MPHPRMRPARLLRRHLEKFRRLEYERAHRPLECERVNTDDNSESSGAENTSRRARTPHRRPECERTHANATLARKGQRCRRAARKMRAGSHKRLLGHQRNVIKKEKVSKHICFISQNLRHIGAQNANGHTQTPPWPARDSDAGAQNASGLAQTSPRPLEELY